MYPIVDLHCDLLSSIRSNMRSEDDPSLRASFPQLSEGGVALQTLALFAETKKGSHAIFQDQLETFRKMEKERWRRFRMPLSFAKARSIQTVVSIENASGLLEEDEEFELLFKRLDSLISEGISPLYISLTWNHENRFGGGNFSPGIGLKREGELLCEYLSSKKIAVDLSHTSDSLAHDLFNFVSKKGLKIPIIASHSNFRSIENHPRNLPDDLAREVFHRDGIMGLNVICNFIGKPFEENYMKHIERGISLGGMSKLVFGADFFCDDDFPTLQHLAPFFHETFSNASKYPQFLKRIEERFGTVFASNMANKNFENYCSRWLA